MKIFKVEQALHDFTFKYKLLNSRDVMISPHPFTQINQSINLGCLKVVA